MHLNLQINDMMFSDYNESRKLFRSLGVSLSRKVNEWKPLMYLAHPDAVGSNVVKFEVYEVQGGRCYRFHFNSEEARKEWLDYWHKKGFMAYWSA